ncbi:hypothetical protein SCP_0107680 [Sparassis crispa]|uniref:Uncharacterized protein n=1 Tax=Sparassis crispa TaxID=139825 RepID=A0A401G6U0_9APHY|nr:hypothetical protein SCP_0107680 [Sparassis crispa]GBE77886.1 hypothetical protein SCP_0107680 [Sparassis crispa]
MFRHYSARSRRASACSWLHGRSDVLTIHAHTKGLTPSSMLYHGSASVLEGLRGTGVHKDPELEDRHAQAVTHWKWMQLPVSSPPRLEAAIRTVPGSKEEEKLSRTVGKSRRQRPGTAATSMA